MGRGVASWTIDYVELPGDPAEDHVWLALQDLLLRPLEHSLGGAPRVEACAIDIGGHRTEGGESLVRKRIIRRTLAIFGAVPNNAPVLGRGKLQDINWRGQMDKRGVHIHAVGTVAIKHLLYSRLSTDADKAPSATGAIQRRPQRRLLRRPHRRNLQPGENRFEKRRGAPRNEPLDTWVYSYAATHHLELRLHRHTKADWDAREAAAQTGERRACRRECSGRHRTIRAVGSTPSPTRPQKRWATTGDANERNTEDVISDVIDRVAAAAKVPEAVARQVERDARTYWGGERPYIRKAGESPRRRRRA